uniref:Uncharacterized protein n=1 Tax=Anguilla anguilla TaxID=7936 RepID=A0A0E9XCJ4_ANGAN
MLVSAVVLGWFVAITLTRYCNKYADAVICYIF